MKTKKIVSPYLTLIFIVGVIIGVYGFIVPMMVSVDNDIVVGFGFLLGVLTPLTLINPVKSFVKQIDKL